MLLPQHGHASGRNTCSGFLAIKVFFQASFHIGRIFFDVFQALPLLVLWQALEVDDHCVEIQKNIDRLAGDFQHEPLKFSFAGFRQGINGFFEHFPFLFRAAHHQTFSFQLYHYKL